MKNRSNSTVRRASMPRRPTNASRAWGFSLIELIMTMSVAAILLTIAVPSFQYVTNSNRATSEVNGLLGDLQFARAEAIKEGKYVTVCVSSDQATCANTANWQSGWIVFVDTSPPQQIVPAGTLPLRIQKAFASDTFEANNNLYSVTFNRNGYAQSITNGTLISLHTTPPVNAWTRCLSIALSGAVATGIYNSNLNGTNCT